VFRCLLSVFRCLLSVFRCLLGTLASCVCPYMSPHVSVLICLSLYIGCLLSVTF
jgi:hypothetical protein